MKTVFLATMAILIGAQAINAEPQPIPRQAQTQDGRFAIVFGPFMRADLFLLDTHTGRIWRNVVNKDWGEFFQEIPVQKDDNETWTKWAANRAESDFKAFSDHMLALGFKERKMDGENGQAGWLDKDGKPLPKERLLTELNDFIRLYSAEQRTKKE